jgi:hypothetical protein
MTDVSVVGLIHCTLSRAGAFSKSAAD